MLGRTAGLMAMATLAAALSTFATADGGDDWKAEAPVDGIGVQGHFRGDTVDPVAILERLDQLAVLGLPIWVTEYDTVDADDVARGEKLENCYRASFSHPSVEGVLRGARHANPPYAIYRDGCKQTQPLSTRKVGQKEEESAVGRPARRRLPDEREAITHKFSNAGHEGYVTVGLYPDTRQPGEIFVVMAKQGSPDLPPLGSGAWAAASPPRGGAHFCSS